MRCIGELERQLRNPNTSRMDGRFAFRTGVPERLAAGLSTAEAKLYATIGAAPLPLDRLLVSTAQNATLARLVSRGLVHVAGFTPSDAAHVLGKQSNWNESAARLGAELFARKRDGRGQPVAPTPEAISERVLVALTRTSAEVILETAFAEDGLDGAATVAHALVQRAVDGRDGIARLSVALDRPVIGLGASAPLHYEGLPQLVGNRCIVPEHTDVANALGAVVGQVRVSAEALVSQPREGLFRLSAGEAIRDFTDEVAAIAAAEAVVRQPQASGRWRPGRIRPRSRSSGKSRPPPSKASAASSKRGSWPRPQVGRGSRRETPPSPRPELVEETGKAMGRRRGLCHHRCC